MMFAVTLIVFLIILIISSKKYYQQIKEQKHAAILQMATRRKLSIRQPLIKEKRKRFISPHNYQYPRKSVKLD